MVVLTGASSVLGEALAHTFYRAGCKLILVGPNEHELERVRVHLISIRPKDVAVYQPECVAIDLTDSSGIPNKVAGILEQCGQIDILVNNASICTRSDVMSSTLDCDIRVMNVNYFTTVAFTKGKYMYFLSFFLLFFYLLCRFSAMIKKRKMEIGRIFFR